MLAAFLWASSDLREFPSQIVNGIFRSLQNEVPVAERIISGLNGAARLEYRRLELYCYNPDARLNGFLCTGKEVSTRAREHVKRFITHKSDLSPYRQLDPFRPFRSNRGWMNFGGQ